MGIPGERLRPREVTHLDAIRGKVGTERPQRNVRFHIHAKTGIPYNLEKIGHAQRDSSWFGKSCRRYLYNISDQRRAAPHAKIGSFSRQKPSSRGSRRDLHSAVAVTVSFTLYGFGHRRKDVLRLASICLKEGIKGRPWRLASFCNSALVC